MSMALLGWFEHVPFALAPAHSWAEDIEISSMTISDDVRIWRTIHEQRIAVVGVERLL